MVPIEIEYEGNLRCRAVHGPSGVVVSTDAPVDNQGLGESFSPTDLVATALGSCILTILGIQARTLGIDISGTIAHVQKEMTSVPPRMIAKLAVTIRVPKPIPQEIRERFVNAAHTCPVHRSLHIDVEKPIEFVWV